MKRILEDIKQNKFQPVYLLYGAEDYLKLQYRDKLVRALMPEEDTMNYAHFEGKGLSEGEIIDLAETMPFFSERRVIVLEDTDFFKNAADKIPDYVKELPEYLTMIFVETNVDKRNRLYKAVQKAGCVTEFITQDERTLLQWVGQMLKRDKKNISKADAEYLLSRTGTDMSNIAGEVEKLICYTLDRDVVTRKDIDEVCSEQTESKIFDMIRAVTERNQEKALHLYYDLLALKEPPMRILYLIARQFNQLLQIKELSNKGFGQQEIATRMGVQGFIVRNGLACVRSYTANELKNIVIECTNTEEEVKTGQMSDNLSVELLIVKYSAKQRS